MRLKRWIKRFLLWGGVLLACVVVLAAAGVWYLSTMGVPTIRLDSPEGQALLQRRPAVDYPSLKQNWVLQLSMHCCPAAAVTVMNALQPGAGHTQNNLFVPETAHIVTQDEVYRGQCTLEKLAALIVTRSGLTAQPYHAGPGGSEHDFATFTAHLTRNAEQPTDHIIINYSRMVTSGLGGQGGGHCSNVAAYDAESAMVLLLDPSHDPFWIGAADLYAAMNTTDDVSQKHRGWVVVSK